MLNMKQAIQIVQLTGILPHFGILAEKIWQDMSAIGMNVELVPVDISEYSSLFSGAQKGEFDIMPGEWGTVNQYPLLAVSGNSALKVGPHDNMAWWPTGNPPAYWVAAVDALGQAATPAAEVAAAQHLLEVFLDGAGHGGRVQAFGDSDDEELARITILARSGSCSRTCTSPS